MDGNLTATFLTIKSVLPGMKERRSGSILTMSSSAGRRAHPRSPVPYAAAKAGIELMTQDIAAQAGPHNVRVNCIAPETILTERNTQRIPDAQKADLVDAHPIRRLGTPEDVARAALFLTSDDAAWIHEGIILDVAGGRSWCDVIYAADRATRRMLLTSSPRVADAGDGFGGGFDRDRHMECVGVNQTGAGRAPMATWPFQNTRRSQISR